MWLLSRVGLVCHYQGAVLQKFFLGGVGGNDKLYVRNGQWTKVHSIRWAERNQTQSPNVIETCAKRRRLQLCVCYYA